MRSQPDYLQDILRGKPHSGTPLLGNAANVNCHGAWLLGDNQSSLMLDSSRNKRHMTLSKLSGAAVEPNIWMKGRQGGYAYNSVAPSGGGVLTVDNYTPVSVFTVNIWVRPLDFTVLLAPMVDQWNEATTQRSWGLFFFNDAIVYAYTSSNGSNYHVYSTTANALPALFWTMVTVVYGGSGVATKIYFNGKSVTSTDGGGNEANLGVFATAQPIYVGHSISFAGSQRGARARYEGLSIDAGELSADVIAGMYRQQFGRWQAERHSKYGLPVAAPPAGNARSQTVMS